MGGILGIMATTLIIITVIGLAVGAIGTAVGIIGKDGILGIWRSRRQEGRDERKALWESFEKRIELAEARGSKEDADAVRREYEAQLEAWQAQQSLEKIAPREIFGPKEQPYWTPDELDQLRQLLTDSQPLSPAALSAEDYFLRGNAYYKSGQYRQALLAYKQVLELRPDHADTLQNRGVTLRHLKLFEDSLESFNHALTLRPDHAGTFYNRACMYSLWGKPAEALNDLRRAIEGSPENREEARTDADFDNIRDDPRFQELVGEPKPPSDEEEPESQPDSAD